LNKLLLKKLLSCFDKNSFSDFTFKLWELENQNDAEYYVNTEKLENEFQTSFEQVLIKYNGKEKEYQHYNLILPFYEPLEFFIKNDHIKIADSPYFKILKKYKARIIERMSSWNFTVDGAYSYPTIAFVSNIAGLEEEDYQNYVLPKLNRLLKRSKIAGTTKIGTCDSFIDLSYTNTLNTFENIFNSNKGITISMLDDSPSIQEYSSEKYLTSGLLSKSSFPLSPVYIHTTTSDILNEFQKLLNDISRERELELFIGKYYKNIFGERYDRIELQTCLNFPEFDIADKNRRLDIFLRNAIENDWELLELKHIIKPIKLSQGIPMFTSKIYAAIEQLKNYGKILNQDNVRRKLALSGIEYFKPELKLVLTKKPDISLEHWRSLKSNNETFLKIVTMDDIFKEATMRYQNQLSFLEGKI
jgi:hypothetical protein